MGSDEMSHTPGPWHVDEHAKHEITTEKGPFWVAHVNYHLEMNGELAKKEVEANARLISAAPDLLAVCQAARQALRSYQYGNGSPDLAVEIADACEAAIAKATTPPPAPPLP